MRFKVCIDNSTCHKSVEYLKVELTRVFLIRADSYVMGHWIHKAKDKLAVSTMEYKKPCGKEEKVTIDCELVVPTLDMPDQEMQDKLVKDKFVRKTPELMRTVAQLTPTVQS